MIDEAVALLNEVGLDGFTTRALTDRLGVQRGALYWHVKSKHELLTAVAVKVVEPALRNWTATADWPEAYTGFAQRLRTAMLAHRDGARLVASYIPGTPRTQAAMQEHLAGLAELGIPPELAARFGDTVASYVTGFVLQEQATGEQDPELFTASVNTIILGMRAELGTL